MKEVKIIELKELPYNELEVIINESVAEGYSLVKRLKENWESGKNRFDKTGELYLGAYIGDKLVGVGGVNVDPYSNNHQIGRLRHLYVMKGSRRLGVARMIVNKLLDHSKNYFKAVRLRSNNIDNTGNSFYRAMNFKMTQEEHASHILEF